MEAHEVIREISRSLVSADWNDPLSTIGLFQAIYRLFAFGNKEYYVLHGSAALTRKGTAVVFGDDGKSTRGKTACAVELATESQSFICDEYVLYHVETGRIFANPHRPIHFKGITASHLREHHGLKVKDQRLVLPSSLFNIVDVATLDVIVIPVLLVETKVSSSLEEIKGQERLEILRACIFGHLAKLMNPELDRTSLITKTSKDCAIDMGNALTDFPLIDIPARLYRANLATPCEISMLLEKEGY